LLGLLERLPLGTEVLEIASLRAREPMRVAFLEVRKRLLRLLKTLLVLGDPLLEEAARRVGALLLHARGALDERIEQRPHDSDGRLSIRVTVTDAVRRGVVTVAVR